MTTALPPASRLALRLRRAATERSGVAATEFALLLPLMLVIFVGVSEVGQAVAISRKVTITVRTITDLVTQYSALSTSNMTSLLNASAQVMAPYPSANVTVIVSEVSTNSSGTSKVDWSAALNGTAYQNGQSVTLPSGMNQPSTTVIWGQVRYQYTPVFGYNVIGTIPLSDRIYLNSRLCTKIAYPPLASQTTPSSLPSTLTTACNS